MTYEEILKLYENDAVTEVNESVAAYQVGKAQGDFTIDDYYHIPEDKRVELIDGVFFDMAAPGIVHQYIVGEIFAEFRNFIRENNGSCVPFISPIAVRLNCDDRTMVEPDFIVVCNRDRLQDKVVFGVPDFVAEVLSPSTRKKDMYLKLMKYADAGVREYWIIDPEHRHVIVYDLERQTEPMIYGFEETIPVKIFDEKLKIDFRRVCEYHKV